MADTEAKSAWEKQNVIQVAVKINRNQDPELYRLLSAAASRSETVRDLLRKAIQK